MKDYLDLPVFLKCANESDAHNFDLKPDLFTQFAANSFFGLLSGMNETAGDAPATAGAKTMMKQQDSIARINHHRGDGHRKARFSQQHAEAPRPFRRAPPQRFQYSLQHILRSGAAGRFQWLARRWQRGPENLYPLLMMKMLSEQVGVNPKPERPKPERPKSER